MWIVALLSLLAASPGPLAPDLDPGPVARLDRSGDPRDPCAGRGGWVGDGEDGRDPPACDGAEDDAPDDGGPATGWLRREEDGEDEDRP